MTTYKNIKSNFFNTFFLNLKITCFDNCLVNGRIITKRIVYQALTPSICRSGKHGSLTCAHLTWTSENQSIICFIDLFESNPNTNYVNLYLFFVYPHLQLFLKRPMRLYFHQLLLLESKGHNSIYTDYFRLLLADFDINLRLYDLKSYLEKNNKLNQNSSTLKILYI